MPNDYGSFMDVPFKKCIPFLFYPSGNIECLVDLAGKLKTKNA